MFYALDYLILALWTASAAGAQYVTWVASRRRRDGCDS